MNKDGVYVVLWVRVMQIQTIDHTASSQTCPPPYLVGGCIQVGEGDVQQVVLQRVDPRGDGQLQGFKGFVGDFLTEDPVQSSHAVT